MIAPVLWSNLAPEFGSLFMWPTGTIVSALLILVCVLFEDDLPIPTWVKLAVAADLVLSFVFFSDLSGETNQGSVGPLTALTKLCLLTAAIYIVLRGHKDDLIHQRARLRLFLVGSIAWSMVPLLLVQIFSLPYATTGVYLFVDSVIFFNASIILIAFIKLNPDFELVRKPALTPTQSSDDVEITYLLERMVAERLYADPAMRLKSLAEKIGWSEAKLRQKVNRELGYRNFNQFINRFRLDEACNLLLAQNDKAVLTIALDVGFSSISSFNAVFQTQYGMNPTQFRESNQ